MENIVLLEWLLVIHVYSVNIWCWLYVLFIFLMISFPKGNRTSAVLVVRYPCSESVLFECYLSVYYNKYVIFSASNVYVTWEWVQSEFLLCSYLGGLFHFLSWSYFVLCHSSNCLELFLLIVKRKYMDTKNCGIVWDN